MLPPKYEIRVQLKDFDVSALFTKNSPRDLLKLLRGPNGSLEEQLSAVFASVTDVLNMTSVNTLLGLVGSQLNFLDSLTTNNIL